MELFYVVSKIDKDIAASLDDIVVADVRIDSQHGETVFSVDENFIERSMMKNKYDTKTLRSALILEGVMHEEDTLKLVHH